MTNPTPPRSRARDLPRKLAHLVGVVLGWVGFVWMWGLVAARPWDSQRLLWLIVGSLLIVPLLTVAWVLHNRSLHRRKGERQSVAAADMSYTHDWHGRSVQADWAALRRSRIVLVAVEGERKRYVGQRVDVPAQVEPAPRGPMPPPRQPVAQHLPMK